MAQEDSSMQRTWLRLMLCAAGAMAGAATPASADAVRLVCLVIDLDGDGVRLGDRDYAVRFDVDGDGVPERVQWTAKKQREAFLWSDADGDGALSAGELLGMSLSTPVGRSGRVGWRALADLDRPSAGGNGDARLDATDAAWRDLRLWLDLDHDGVAGPSELQRLEEWRIAALDLRFQEGLLVDAGMNLHTAWGGVTVLRESSKARPAKVTEVHLPVVGEPSSIGNAGWFAWSRRIEQADDTARPVDADPLPAGEQPGRS
jgi:hypothetical protein